MKGASRRGPFLCSARATRSLPVPDSPEINTTPTFTCARSRSWWTTERMAGASPISSAKLSSRCTCSSAALRASLMTRSMSFSSCSIGKGLVTYCAAPRAVASMAASMPVYAVITIVGVLSPRARKRRKVSSPLIPGICKSNSRASTPPWTRSRASSPAAASMTVWPARTSVDRKSARWSSSSSQMSTVRPTGAVDFCKGVERTGVMGYLTPAVCSRCATSRTASQCQLSALLPGFCGLSRGQLSLFTHRMSVLAWPTPRRSPSSTPPRASSCRSATTPTSRCRASAPRASRW
jgi:hypothetical protein